MKNILNRNRVYLVGQMQYIKDGSVWRDYVEAELKKMGVIVFNPYNHPFINSVTEDNNATATLKSLIAEGKYDECAEIMRKIRGEDLRVVDIADFIFCYIDPLKPTCGAWEEVFTANRAKKPIFFVAEGGKDVCPLWLYGTIPHKYMYNSIDDALQMLWDINSGAKPIDSSRWRILRPEFL